MGSGKVRVTANGYRFLWGCDKNILSWLCRCSHNSTESQNCVLSRSELCGMWVSSQRQQPRDHNRPHRHTTWAFYSGEGLTITSVLTSGLYIHAHTQACTLTHANTHTLKNRTAHSSFCAALWSTLRACILMLQPKNFYSQGQKIKGGHPEAKWKIWIGLYTSVCMWISLKRRQ